MPMSKMGVKSWWVVAHLRDWIWGQDGRDEDGVQMAQ